LPLVSPEHNGAYWSVTERILLSLAISICGGLIVRWISSSDALTLLAAVLFLLLSYRMANSLVSLWKALDLCKIRGSLASRSTAWLEHLDASNRREENIRMMIITGDRTLSGEETAFYKKLISLPIGWKGSIRILLIDPDSPFISLVAQMKGVMSDDMIKKQINTAEASIENLERSGRRISVKHYRSFPAWRFILFREVGYFSYTCGGSLLPVYIRVSGGTNSLHQLLSDIFEREWVNAR